jgi:hypothetical protein
MKGSRFARRGNTWHAYACARAQAGAEVTPKELMRRREGLKISRALCAVYLRTNGLLTFTYWRSLARKLARCQIRVAFNAALNVADGRMTASIFSGSAT